MLPCQSLELLPAARADCRLSRACRELLQPLLLGWQQLLLKCCRPMDYCWGQTEWLQGVQLLPGVCSGKLLQLPWKRRCCWAGNHMGWYLARELNTETLRPSARLLLLEC